MTTWRLLALGLFLVTVSACTAAPDVSVSASPASAVEAATRETVTQEIVTPIALPEPTATQVPEPTATSAPVSVDDLSQAEMNAILDTNYADLTGADRQLWIDVYASEFVEGFYKAQQGRDVGDMTAFGDSESDTVHIDVSVRGQLDPDTLNLVIGVQCEEEPLVWAMDQGLTLHQIYRDSFGGSMEWAVSSNVCAER